MKRLFKTALLVAVASGGLQLGVAEAAVVCSAPINHLIAADLDGTSANWLTGDVQDNDIAAYHFNAWSSSGTYALFWESSTDNAGVAATATGPYLVLHAGDTISTASAFNRSTSTANTANWRSASNVDGYLGFRFNCGGGQCFGYTHMTTTGTTGFPATLVDYCYENTVGTSITIPAAVVTHTVTPSVGTPSGTISPSTAQVVNDGATTAFTLAADPGFHIDTVTGTCPAGSTAGGVYTTGAIIADCTVIANFAADGGGGGFPPDEDFDEVTAPALPAGWTGSGFTTVTDSSDTAPNAAFSTELAVVSDFTLDTPAFTPTGLVNLTFRHKFNLEDTFDGAVLEIAIDGGAFTDIVTAGGVFGTGGYTDTISTAWMSPIAGRQAWSGSSGSFITTTVTLPSAATGHSTVLRFRTADDSSVTATGTPGWWVDSLHMTSATTPSVAKAFAPASVATGADSTLTITLSNPTAGASTLTANLVDTLPVGLLADAGSATTDCVGGAGASNTTSSVTLGTGAVIPATGSCTVVVTVNSDTVGSYVNTIAAGALQTSTGSNDTAATATLTVLGAPVIAVTGTLDLTAAQGDTDSDPLNIANTGGSNLTFAVGEGETPLAPHGLLQNGSRLKPAAARAVADQILAKHGPVAFNAGPKAGLPQSMHRPVKPLGVGDISQMADNTPGDEGVSCNSGTATTANSFFRRFYFNEHPGVGAAAAINSVTVASGSTSPGDVPVTINLYTIPHSTPVDTIPLGSLTAIGTGSGTIATPATPTTIATTGTVADTTGSDLVVEFHIEALSTGAFFPSANATPETHPSFLLAADCGVTEPTAASAIGFPDDHLTMIVNVGTGTPPETCANPSDIPWLSESPASGTVAAGANTNVTVTGDATGLAVGTYTAQVCVGSNDPVNPVVTVPVTLTVTEGVVVPCSGGADTIFCDGFEAATGPGSCDPEQLFEDTSFEASLDGSGPWTSTSTNFGTALCDEATCGTGGGTAGPLTGGIWAWMGGAGGSAEVATVSQAVTIPTGSDRFLNFNLWVGSVGASGAVLTVNVDGTPVTTFPEPAVAETGYTIRSVDLSAFADGGSHTIELSYDTPAGTNSNFNIDDVTLDCTAAAPRPAK